MDATKRPWIVAKDPDNNVIGRDVLEGIWAGEDIGPDRPGNIQIARITYGGKSRQENNANARLIVKAVNLHDELVDLLKSYIAEWHNDAFNFYRKEPDTLKCARALLKRVKGE